jgi:hypothetical protein
VLTKSKQLFLRSMQRDARAVPGLGSLAGSVAGIAADMKSSMPTMEKEGSFKKGGLSKARGTGIAIRGTKFKGVY